MEKNIIVRKARKDDYKQVNELVKEVHRIHIENRSDIYKDCNPIDFESYEEEIANTNNIYLVAEINNIVLGICFAEVKRILNNKIMKDRTIIQIINICVKKENRKKGIGTQLYNEILKIAEQLKVDSVELIVWEFNNNAINFYKKLGMNLENLRFEQKIMNK